MNTQKFLDFQGKKITLVSNDGTFYVAIKPICEVLEIDFEAQRLAIQKRKILQSTTVKLTAVGADKKEREMLCMPEKYIYGWLLTIIAKTEKLEQYQQECYETLYNHFHLKQATRDAALTDRNMVDEKILQLQNKMQTTIEYTQMDELLKLRKEIAKNLTNIG